MKKMNGINFYGAVMLLTLIFVQPANVFSQTNVKEKLSQHPTAVNDLMLGIQSENEGLRKSSIYFAGKYRIKEVVPALIDQMDEEKNPSIRILIANTLFRIGDERGIEKIIAVSAKDDNGKVRRICNALVQEYKTTLRAENLWKIETY